MRLKFKRYLFLTGGILLFFCAFVLDIFNKKDAAKLTSQANIAIQQKALELQNALKSLDSSSYTENIDQFRANEIALYVFEDSLMTYWNNSQVPVSEVLKDSYLKPVIKLRNGYYLAQTQRKNRKLLLALACIKTNFDLENSYLINQFENWTGLPEGTSLTDSKKTAFQVSLNNQYLFSLSYDEPYYRNKLYTNIQVVLLLIGIILLMAHTLILIMDGLPFLRSLIPILLLIFFRLGMVYFKWPGFIYDSTLYNLRVFGNAQSFLNAYLGDLILNGIILLWLSIVCLNYLKKIKERNLRIIINGCVVSLLLIESLFYHHVFFTLVSNSTITFDFFNILNLSANTYIALIPIAFINMAIPVTLYSIWKYSYKRSRHAHLYYFILLLGLTLSLNALLNFSINIERFWIFPAGLIIAAIAYWKFEKNIIAIGLFILTMAFVSSVILNAYISKNQQKDLELLSYKLTERQDAVLENEFKSLSHKIISNDQLINLSQFVAFNGEKEFLQLLNQNFFFGYFDRYNITYSMFDKDCTPLLKTSDPIMQNEGFFEEQIRYQSIPTIDSTLYFIDQHKEYARYISRMSLGKNVLYIMLEPKFFEEIGAFPDLLMDESQQKQNRLRNLSYAVYRSGINNKMYGDFNYPVNLSDSLKLISSDSKFTHSFFYPDETSTVVISSRKKDLYYFFTYNSYLFLLFSLIAYIGYQAYSAMVNRGKLTPSLTRRIQTTVVLLLLLSITSVGIISNTLVSEQFDRDNEKRLQEKSNTILSELSGLMQNSDSLTDQPKELIDQAIKRYAYVFNSDVSIFNNKGFLYLTSQPRLYELGLTAPFLNARADYVLGKDLMSSFCSKDKAGNLDYLSYYTPIYNADKKLLGYLNLPYFGKQSVITNEISNIISTLINVYVILFIISIVSGLVLSGYITLPLRLLKQKMGKVILGSKNEVIHWDSNDEVGSLVNEYNQMIEKLDNSANMLARSQREMAWREMAKQVAHEIKNPLTPMKLNLQYLQHVLKDNPEDFEERFKKASNSIIEQIDTLANIATEFSNFAKLPTGQIEKIDLAEIISSSKGLFEKEQQGNIRLLLHEEHLYLNADKEQMLRVFNNLIKNAIQATSEMPDPKIIIESERTDGGFLIKIRDNGIGIPDEIREKIFTPNFTTKSTGSGLGLAMVKNILDTIHAEIWFESENEKGTTFYLQFNEAID